jgi:DNA repair protein RadC
MFVAKLHRFEVEARLSLVRDAVVAQHLCSLDAPIKAAKLLCSLIGRKPKEHFVVLALNARSIPLGVVTVSIGTLSASLVHPREVFGPAILLNAAAIIVSHNHPSGDVTPSAEDKDATRRLQRAGELLGIPVLDHIIVFSEEFISMKDTGYFQ